MRRLMILLAAAVVLGLMAGCATNVGEPAQFIRYERLPDGTRVALVKMLLAGQPRQATARISDLRAGDSVLVESVQGREWDTPQWWPSAYVVSRLTAPDVHVSQSPSGSGQTVVRRGGIGYVDLSARLATRRNPLGAGHPMTLQRSADGSVWEQVRPYSTLTDANGRVSVRLAFKGAGASYWRWAFFGDEHYGRRVTPRILAVAVWAPSTRITVR